MTASHRAWFQSANRFRNSLVSMAMRIDVGETPFSCNNRKRQATGQQVPLPSYQSTIKLSHCKPSEIGKPPNGATTMQTRGKAVGAFRVPKRNVGTSKGGSHAISVSENENGVVAPPYQQVRTAVAEAIVNATSNQRPITYRFMLTVQQRRI